ncbi:MAG: hypothetical protein P8P34_01055 [Flavobacteriaceae bacterium]|jgi:hypothetical protein|nr:hypothetical protein [Flavobacteriaceae bacterium]
MANTTGNKYGGREKGTPNRITKELRSLLKDVMFEEIEVLQEHIEALKPKEKESCLLS